MGFKPQTTTYKLVFEDEEFAGLEVHCRPVSLGQFLRLGEAQRLAELGSRAMNADDIRTIAAQFEGFADALVSWNLEDDDGNPVPATLEGIKSQDLDLMLAVVAAWTRAVAGVDPDLGKGSTPGPPSDLEASMPMDVQSPSPPSWPTPNSS